MINVSELRICYDDREVLSVGDAAFYTGTITTILGKNGSGKSTFLRALSGIQSSEGRIECDGRDIKEMAAPLRARLIGYLPQNVARADMTVSMLVAHGRFPWKSFPRRLNDKDKKIMSNAIESVGITHIASKNLREISGGELKLAYLAMLLSQDTDVLLLDEPDAHLDISHQSKMYDILKDAASEGKTVILTSHDLIKTMNHSDMIYVLSSGKKYLEGTPDQIATESEKLKRALEASVVEAENDRSMYKYIYAN